jgi:hypothetical protein
LRLLQSTPEFSSLWFEGFGVKGRWFECLEEGFLTLFHKGFPRAHIGVAYGPHRTDPRVPFAEKSRVRTAHPRGSRKALLPEVPTLFHHLRSLLKKFFHVQFLL